jgi:predicted MPP superfamily phosphohydrolase
MSDAYPSVNSGSSPTSAPPRPVVEKPTSEEFSRIRLQRFWRLLVVVQSILLLAHWILYATWIAFHPSITAKTHGILRIVFLAAAMSFVLASVLAWNYFNAIVRVFYVTAAVWIGLMNFCLFAAAGCWIVLGATRLAGAPVARSQIADVLFAAGLLVGAYGLINAACVRVTRVDVKLPNLPEAWRGRVAALVSDTHLGHIRNIGFMRRIVNTLNHLRPDVVFIAGDMYDGTRANVEALAEPLSSLSAPLGAFYVTGNHEEFTNRDRYLEAVSKAGVRVLNNEKIELQGLQILGVHYREFVDPQRFRAILRKASIASDRPSILVAHAPHRLSIAEEAGISLQVCGHTHGGQFPPGTWVASRIYGPYVHGLHPLSRMLVLTNWGAGTWGPPFRVGTKPEIVLMRYEPA